MPLLIAAIIRERIAMSLVHLNTLSFMQQLHRQVLVAVPCKTAKHEIGHLTFTLLCMIMKCKGMTAASKY